MNEKIDEPLSETDRLVLRAVFRLQQRGELPTRSAGVLKEIRRMAAEGDPVASVWLFRHADVEFAVKPEGATRPS